MRRSPLLLKAFARLFRLVWGDDVERALRPVLLVGFVGALAGSATYTFIGIWAIDELGARDSQLGFAFLAGALLGALSGYLGGHLSDHLGRRPLILLGWALNAMLVLAFLGVGGNVLLGLALIALAPAFGAMGGAADQAMVADLVPQRRREAAYASVRVASNLGVTMGPPIAGALLALGDWNLFFAGVAALAGAAVAVAWRFIPRRGAYAPERPPDRGSFGVIRRDRAFLVFLVSSAFAWLVYVSYETVLPISLVDTHGIAPSTWGFLVIVNPLLVTFGQLRLTRRVAHVSPALRLAVAMVLMGTPFLLFSVNAAIPTILFVLVVFVVGEMLWVPTSQGIVARLAPDDVRGAYMGAFGSTGAFGFAIAPFVGLQIRSGFGDDPMWAFFAVAGVVAAATGVIACIFSRDRIHEPSPVLATP